MVRRSSGLSILTRQCLAIFSALILAPALIHAAATPTPTGPYPGPGEANSGYYRSAVPGPLTLTVQGAGVQMDTVLVVGYSYAHTSSGVLFEPGLKVFFGSQQMTPVATLQTTANVDNSAGKALNTELWYLRNPSAGTANIAVTPVTTFITSNVGYGLAAVLVRNGAVVETPTPVAGTQRVDGGATNTLSIGSSKADSLIIGYYQMQKNTIVTEMTPNVVVTKVFQSNYTTNAPRANIGLMVQPAPTVGTYLMSITGAATVWSSHQADMEILPLTPTYTNSYTPTFSPTNSFTQSETFTESASPSSSVSPTWSESATRTISPSPTDSPTMADSPTHTPSRTVTETFTDSPTASHSPTWSDSPTLSDSPTKTDSPTGTFTNSPTNSPTPSNTPSPSSTPIYLTTFFPSLLPS